MKIVIDIPEEVLNSIKTFKGKFICENGYDLIQGIKDGIPLPKGHGRLIDMEELLNTFWAYCKQGDFGYHQVKDLIKSAQPIIEADKAESEGV